MGTVSEPLQPQQEVEVQGEVGMPLALPLDAAPDGAYVWTLDLPDEVAAADQGPDGRLRVVVDRPGSYVLTATLGEPGAATPMTILLIRTTVT